MTGSKTIRLDTPDWGFINKSASSEHILKLTTNDGRYWTASAIKGQSLAEDLPWIFVADDTNFRFVKQGGGSLPNNEAIVLIPKDWKVLDEYLPFINQIGSMQNPLREIYQVNQTTIFKNAEGLICKVAVKSANSDLDNYDWRGNRWWLDFTNPSIAFKGKPKLYRVDDNGNGIGVNTRINCSSIGSLTPNSQNWLGVSWLSYTVNSEIKQKTKVLLLPEDASVKFKPKDAISGEILFENWDITNAFVETENVNFNRENNGNRYSLQVSIDSENKVPDQISLNLFWKHSSTPAKLKLPFPCRGVRAFDGAGTEIEKNTLLAVNQLFGVRLNVLSGTFGKQIYLKLQTEDRKIVRKFHFKPLADSVKFEIKLTDYLTDIEHLLSLNDSPDAKIRAIVMIEKDEQFSLNIARYSAYLARDGENILITLNSQLYQESDLPIYTFRLEDTNSEPSLLLKNEENENSQFKWIFAPQTREPGAWLIYPAKESKVSFRPTLWGISGELELDSEFARATNISNPREREKAFDKLIDDLANDFFHHAWADVNRLAQNTGHLPLTTLDIWRGFARSPLGMAALAFRLPQMPKGFVSRFEKELPFAWEAVSFPIWRKAIKQSNLQYEDYLSQVKHLDISLPSFAEQIQPRIDKFVATHGSLSYLLGIASIEFFPNKTEEFQMLRQAGGYLANSLFDGENSPFMKLRRNLGDWEEDKDEILKPHWENPEIRKYLYLKDLGYQNDIINTPLLLAVESVLDISESWLNNPEKIHLLRTFRAFSPEWFEDAYNVTIVKCLADGLMENK